MANTGEQYQQRVEQASDEAHPVLVAALLVYLATRDEQEQEEDDEQAIVFFLRSALTPLILAVWGHLRPYTPADDWVDIWQRSEVTDSILVAAAASWLQARRDEPGILSGNSDEQALARLENVVTTLVTQVVSLVQLASAEAMGFGQKTWRTRLDAKVRHTHRELEGVTVALGEKFRTTGYTILYPGDRSAPPEGWINCRCVLRLISHPN